MKRASLIIFVSLILALLAPTAGAICNTNSQTFTFVMNRWNCVVHCSRTGRITGGECVNPVKAKQRDVIGGQLYDLFGTGTWGLLTPIRQGEIILTNDTLVVTGIQAGGNLSAGSGWIRTESDVYNAQQSAMVYQPRN